MRAIFVFLLISAGIVAIAFNAPVRGFAAATALITLILSLPMDLKRLRIERSFFYGDDAFELGAMAAWTLAIGSGIARALAVGAAALFTFPAFLSEPQLKVVGLTVADLEMERMSTLYVFLIVLFLAVVSGMLVNRFTQGLGYRWSMFRFIWLYCLLFSVGAFAAQAISPVERPSAFALVDVIRDADDVRNDAACPDLEDEMAALEEKEIKGPFDWLFGTGADRRKKEQALRRNHCGVTLDASFSNIILAVSTMDDFVDGLTQSVVAGTTSTIGAGEGPGRLFSGIFLSSNLVQGFVIAIYASLILMLAAPVPGREQDGGHGPWY